MNALKSRYLAIAAALALLAGNIYVCRELFVRPYLNQMASIEAAFISIARYASQNLNDLTWFPLWYNGIPYQNTYPPLLHLMVALVIRITGADPGLAYHAVTATLYCAGAVTVFALAWRLSRSIPYSFFAGLLYSFISPSAFLVADIRHDLGSVWRPRRLHTLLAYGEGPHVAGLTLLPLAILALDVAVKRKNPIWTALAAIAFAATVLTNWLAAAALGAAVVAYLLCNYSVAAVCKTALVSVLAYAFAAPWIPPSTIRVIQFNAKTIGGDFTNVYRTLPLYGSLIVAGVLALVLLFRRLDAAPVVRFSAIYAFLMAALVLPAEYAKVYIMPQPHRYHLEMELGLVMLIPFLIKPLVDLVPTRARLALAAVLIIATVAPAKQYRRYARVLMSPVDITRTAEYRIAKWFDQNMHGQSVFATGSVSFWMNAFTDTPQIGGGFDQGTINFMNRVMTYLVYSDDGVAGDKLETTALWFKAFGVAAVQPSGPQSGEWYHPMRHPEKFEPYEALWRDGPEVVYKVPLRSTSLAHVMTRADLAPRTPVNGIDIEPFRPYVAALDNPAYPEARFRWTSRHSAEIKAQLTPGQVLSVQVTYHPGWHASKGTVTNDPLGFIVVDPQCSGACTVTLEYDGGLEMKIARLLAWGALATSLGWAIWIKYRSDQDHRQP